MDTNSEFIKVVGVEKSFGDNKVLRGTNLSIKKGETIVVIGRSGCGKSVLLKHIIGLLKPDRGKVFVGGTEVTALGQRKLFELRQMFGMLFQSAALFDSLTVWENVGLGLIEHTDMPRDEIRQRASEKLRLVGLKGIEDEKPAELSGGMKKRVGLARAITMDPEIILYDEPTTGLDPIMADVINELICNLKRTLSITSVVVTHDMKSAYKVGDRIAMLYEGEIVFEGTPEEIKCCGHPVIQQFVEGRAEGPIPAL
ncbi:MAG: ABC transporter ATP-binding protein [bacterium]|jgi:phospholipid/cholesterol/gamma-HCH transport system ATP-binding protein